MTVKINADFLKPVDASDVSMKNLVIEDKELLAIKALSVVSHGAEELWNADFIDGKGAGQIILLHG